MRRCSERMPEPAALKPLARPGRNLLDHICCTALDHSVHLQNPPCNCNEHRNLSVAQDPRTCVHARTLVEQRGQDELRLKRRRVDAARHAQARAARVPPASRRTRPCPVSREPSDAGPGEGVAARRALSRSLWPAHLTRSATARGLGRDVRFPRTQAGGIPAYHGGEDRGNGARNPGVSSNLRAQGWSGCAPGMPSRRETHGRTSQCAPAPPTPTCPACPPWSSPRALHGDSSQRSVSSATRNEVGLVDERRHRSLATKPRETVWYCTLGAGHVCSLLP
jgi:hypothetical protein